MSWEAPLSRVLTAVGAELATLRDAAEFISARFGTVLQSALLERAIVLLMTAAESGKPEDRKAATDQLAIVLAMHRQ